MKTLNGDQSSRRNRLFLMENIWRDASLSAGQLVCRHRWPTEVGTSAVPGQNSFWDSVCRCFQKASGAAHPALPPRTPPPTPSNSRPWQRGREVLNGTIFFYLIFKKRADVRGRESWSAFSSSCQLHFAFQTQNKFFIHYFKKCCSFSSGDSATLCLHVCVSVSFWSGPAAPGPRALTSN